MNRTSFDPGPLSEVSCLADADGWTLVLVRTLQHPPDRVWAALTDPEELRAWAPYTASRELGSPGEVSFTMIDADASQDLPATVVRAERPTLLEYTLGTDHLRWELAPAGGAGTRLTLRHTVRDESWVPKVAAGWHLCLVVAEHLLDGEPIEPIRGEDAMNYGWQELHHAYAEELGVAGGEQPRLS